MNSKLIEEIRNSKLIEELWSENPDIYKILKESEDLEEARKKLYDFSKDLEWKYREGEKVLHKLEYATALEAIKVFNNLISF
ncbi:MAG: KamA family radical SAM protein, partial [Candidatus Atribacteria bacterium]|nr:KamA family radical SAM protein [Candidatus Atribacteria bacterium]